LGVGDDEAEHLTAVLPHEHGQVFIDDTLLSLLAVGVVERDLDPRVLGVTLHDELARNIVGSTRQGDVAAPALAGLHRRDLEVTGSQIKDRHELVPSLTTSYQLQQRMT